MKDKIDFENEVLDLDEIKNTLNEERSLGKAKRVGRISLIPGL